MSRTPLFRALHRSLRLAQSTRRTRATRPRKPAERRREADGRHAARLPARPRRRRRRGSPSAAARPAPRARPGRRGRPEVVIVGAGIAASRPVYRLRQQNVPVRDHGSAEPYGGRMFTPRDFFPDGQVVELGGERSTTATGDAGARGRARIASTTSPSTTQRSRLSATSLAGRCARGRDLGVPADRPRIQEVLATLEGEEPVSHEEPNGARRSTHVDRPTGSIKSGVAGWVRKLLRSATPSNTASSPPAVRAQLAAPDRPTAEPCGSSATPMSAST